MKRGFSYTEKNGKRVTDAGKIALGDRVTTRLYRGSIISEVTEKKEQNNG
jgi:exonuclease VII large subunit